MILTAPEQADDRAASMSDPASPDALAFLHVHHDYDGVEAVRELTLSIRPGETVCLLGPSGCGKTTALRIAAGLERPAHGSVYLDGKLASGGDVLVPPENRRVGLVFQDYALFPHLTVARNVGFGLDGRPTREIKERVAAALSSVDMLDYGDAFPHQLSGGQQQRVALARALAPEPAVVLLDEPFSGLDARLRDAVRDKTLHALARTKTAALLVTHDAEEAMYLADRIAVMRDGRLVQIGAPEALYSHPVNAFVAGFFGEVNRFIGRASAGRVETPVGVLETNRAIAGGAEERDVEVVVRPEALSLSPAPDHAMGPGYARVLASRLLGRTSLVHLCTCRTTGEELHLHARVPGPYLPEPGSIQEMILDRRQAFVFPVEAAT